jgi:hypothetical protein
MLTHPVTTSLEEQQRGLLALLRGQSTAHPDPWLTSVTASPGLKMMHSIAGWWHRFQIEWQCRYTSRLMKRLGCFESYVAQHFREHPAPPSIEELSTQFLLSLQDHDNLLLRAVARLELTCIRPQRRRTTTIYWDRNPNRVMDALDRFLELPNPEPKIRYVLRMGAALPDGVSCVREVLSA